MKIDLIAIALCVGMVGALVYAALLGTHPVLPPLDWDGSMNAGLAGTFMAGLLAQRLKPKR